MVFSVYAHHFFICRSSITGIKKQGGICVKKWLSFMVVSILSLGALAACDSEDAEGDVYTIGATQIVEHPSLDAAYDGFQDALEDEGLEVDFDFQSADRKSTRLNSSHVSISYAVFCLKKKKDEKRS